MGYRSFIQATSSTSLPSFFGCEWFDWCILVRSKKTRRTFRMWVSALIMATYQTVDHPSSHPEVEQFRINNLELDRAIALTLTACSDFSNLLSTERRQARPPKL